MTIVICRPALFRFQPLYLELYEGPQTRPEAKAKAVPRAASPATPAIRPRKQTWLEIVPG